MKIISLKSSYNIGKSTFLYKKHRLIWVFCDFIVFLQNNLRYINEINKIIRNGNILLNYSVVKTKIRK